MFAIYVSVHFLSFNSVYRIHFKRNMCVLTKMYVRTVWLNILYMSYSEGWHWTKLVVERSSTQSGPVHSTQANLLDDIGKFYNLSLLRRILPTSSSKTVGQNYRTGTICIYIFFLKAYFSLPVIVQRYRYVPPVIFFFKNSLHLYIVFLTFVTYGTGTLRIVC